MEGASSHERSGGSLLHPTLPLSAPRVSGVELNDSWRVCG